jgi:thiamine biosynthesis lipoprotein
LAGAVFFLISANRRSGTDPSEFVEDNRFLLDTVVTIKLYGSGGTEALEGAFSLIDEYEKRLSRHQSESDTAAVNRTRTGIGVTVSSSTLEVLNAALDYARLSGGLFDPSVGPLVDLWGIGGDTPRVPSDDEIRSILPLVDYRAIEIDPVRSTVTLGKPGMALDLGGIAKGWIADRVAGYLRENGERHILVNLGGNVLVSGGKPDGEPFKIGMQDPFDNRGRYLGVFSLSEGSVVSSGTYERFFESEGIRYHHILDTVSGYPVRNGLAAVTVVSKLSVDGDAMSTTLFAAGIENGLALIRSMDGIEAAFVTQDGRIVMTSGAAELFKPTSPDLEVEIRD